MNIKKNKNQFIISIIIGIAIFALSFQILSRQQQQIDDLKKAKPLVSQAQETSNQYVFTKGELKKGDVISLNNITVKTIPVKVEGGFKDAQEIIGLVLVQDIAAETPLSRDFFSPDDLPTGAEPQKGYRAVSLTTANKSYVPPIKPLTYIDVYSSEGSIVIHDVRVLDIKKDSKAGKVVVLEIKEDNVSDLVKVISEAKEQFALVLKNQSDDKLYGFIYNPKIAEYDLVKGGYADIAPPSNVTNYNIEEFVINETVKERETVEVIRGTEKTECGF